MNDLYRNKAGYSDPTAGKALSRIARKESSKAEKERMAAVRRRPLVYICSRYAGNTELNVFRAIGFCRYAVRCGMIPVASHLLYPQILEDSVPAQRELGLQFGLALLDRCSEIWVFNENRELSEGMRLEIGYARKKGIPVRFHDMKEIER